MKFRDYYINLDADEKISLATRLRTSVSYLSQLAHGHRKAGAALLMQIETATDGAVLPRELRPDIFGEAA